MTFSWILTAVDYLTMGRTPRYEVVAHLYSLPHNQRVRLKTPVPDDDPRLDSLMPVWEGANWFEREVYDMFGLTFDGHPDLRRILLYQGFEGLSPAQRLPAGQRTAAGPQCL